MTLRIAKLALVFAVAIFYSLVVLKTNTTELRLELPVCAPCLDDGLDISGNRGMWRAVNSPVWHTVFFIFRLSPGKRRP